MVTRVSVEQSLELKDSGRDHCRGRHLIPWIRNTG